MLAPPAYYCRHSARPQGKLVVIADRYEAKHTVSGDKLRPAWSWVAGAGHWKQREPAAVKK